MPPLHTCGRRWHVSDDDFVLWCIYAAVFGFIYVLLCLFAVLAELETQDLHKNTFIMIYAFSACSGVLSILLDAALAIVSSRGSIFDARRRAWVPCLVKTKVCLLPLHAVSLIGCVVAIGLVPWDVASKIGVVIISLRLSQVTMLTCSLTWVTTAAQPEEVLVKLGHRILRLIGYFIGKGNDDEDMQAVMRTLELYISGFEATVSDVVAGEIVLGRVQRARRHGLSAPDLAQLHLDGYPWGEVEERQLQRSAGGALPYTVLISDDHVVSDLLHNLCFATAVYGWMLFVYAGRSRLQRNIPEAHTVEGTITHKMNILAVNSFLREWSGHDNSKLVFLSKENAVKMTPYAIFVDSTKKTIVIAVRGTLSISDAVTDVLADPEYIDDPAIVGDLPGPHYVHSGMWQTAQYLLQDINNMGVLAALLEGVRSIGKNGNDDVLPQRSSFRLDGVPFCEDYSLCVVGHSLGAGIAQLLGVLLRPRYPALCVIGYGSPHVVSEALAARMGNCMMQVVVGDDIIPRLSVRNAEIMRDRIFALVAHCPVPKYKLMVGGLRKTWCRPCDALISKSPVSAFASNRLASQAGKRASPRFCHSGRICYLRVLETKTRCCGAFTDDLKYRAEWAQSDDFMEMIISAKMITHHMPHTYRAALESVLSQTEV